MDLDAPLNRRTMRGHVVRDEPYGVLGVWAIVGVRVGEHVDVCGVVRGA
jgi:hypothetical protein